MPRKSKVLDQFGKPIVVDDRASWSARYDAAQTTDENKKHWGQADALSAREANNPDVRRKLRMRSRYEADNDGYYGGMMGTYAKDLFGTGPILQAQISDDDELNQRIEEKFQEHCQAIGLLQQLLTAGETKVRDGETIGIMREETRGLLTGIELTVPLDIQWIEGEQCTTPRDGVPVDLSRWVDGITLDTSGRPQTYHILKYHPGSAFSNWDYNEVPADQIIHWFRRTRHGQYRGVPECTAALPVGSQRRRWSLATLTAAETAAMFAVLITSKLPTDFTNEDLPAEWETMELVRNMITTLPAGGDAHQMAAEHPNQEYGPFKHELLKEQGRPINAPYSVVGMDGSEHNYSSLRYERELWHSALRVERLLCQLIALDKFTRAWYSIGRMIPGYLADDISQLPAVLPFGWNWPGFASIDPLKEAMSDTEALTNGTATLKEIYAATGRDWLVAMRQRQREINTMRKLEIPLPKWADPSAGVSQPAGGAPVVDQSGDANNRAALKLKLLEDAS